MFDEVILQEWVPALIFLVLSFVIPGSMLAAATVLKVRAKKDLPSKYDNYECGEEPDGMAWVRFHPRYYVVALVFVLFDVEAAFLFPWALNIREMGLVAIIDMFIFLGILLAGWAYAVRKGAIRWQ
jgi:NADH-quinone oxidoreductase subunit A